MAVSEVNSDECIICGACISECPNKAISEDPATGQTIIDPNKCDNCSGSPCCQAICPVECIKTVG